MSIHMHYIPVIIYDQQACDAFCSSIEVALVQLRCFNFALRFCSVGSAPLLSQSPCRLTRPSRWWLPCPAAWNLDSTFANKYGDYESCLMMFDVTFKIQI